MQAFITLVETLVKSNNFDFDPSVGRVSCIVCIFYKFFNKTLAHVLARTCFVMVSALWGH